MKNCDAKVQVSEHEKLVQLHTWEKDPASGMPIPPENFGWIEEWGPEPGEDGHSDWYKKPREFMSNEEKAKFDVGITVPLKKYNLRHQLLPYHHKVNGAYHNMSEDHPMLYSTQAKNVDAPYTPQQKRDYIGKARNEFIDEWLSKPGVTPENLAKKIGDYNGTAKLHNIKKLPRRPDWELQPQMDD